MHLVPSTHCACAQTQECYPGPYSGSGRSLRVGVWLHELDVCKHHLLHQLLQRGDTSQRVISQGESKGEDDGKTKINLVHKTTVELLVGIKMLCCDLFTLCRNGGLAFDEEFIWAHRESFTVSVSKNTETSSWHVLEEWVIIRPRYWISFICGKPKCA